MHRLILTLIACLALTQAYHGRRPHKFREISSRAAGGQVEAPQYWVTSAQVDLINTLHEERNIGQAKNVIIFLGDGWGVTTITLSRILKGQEVDKVQFGEEGTLHVDKYPVTGHSITFCADGQVADSACSATAYLCGVKANDGTIGVNSNVRMGDCSGQNNKANHVSSILAWAQAAGKSTGIVTTTRVTHASPAGTYAHIAHRDWECDADMGQCDTRTTDDIAEQLILNDPGKYFNVILGGGRSKFLPNNVTDSEGTPGQRLDGKNLIEEWKRSKIGKRAEYVESLEELRKVDARETDFLFGLFNPGHVAYLKDRKGVNDPGLVDMTRKAIEILRKNSKGYVLFVEGGRIDHAHHDNQGLKALWESIEFDQTIEVADKMTSDRDTLIVATADHSHAVSFSGYAKRGTPVTRFAGMGDDGIPYPIINYANGPAYKPPVDGHRYNISGDDVDNYEYAGVPPVPVELESHGGEDVAIYAKGPMQHLFQGTHMQNYIPHAIAYAACIGHGVTFCGKGNYSQPN